MSTVFVFLVIPLVSGMLSFSPNSIVTSAHMTRQECEAKRAEIVGKIQAKGYDDHVTPCGEIVLGKVKAFEEK